LLSSKTHPPTKTSDPTAPVVSGLLHRPDATAEPLSEQATRKEGHEALAALGASYDVEIEPRLARLAPPLLPVTDNEALWLMPTEVDHKLLWDAGMGGETGPGWERCWVGDEG
jgi:hypothetical protein